MPFQWRSSACGSMIIPQISESQANQLYASYAIGMRKSWRIIKASGQNIRTYLQGQITQDIQKLNETCGIYACLLTPQGKPVSELYIFQISTDVIYMLAPASVAENVVSRLRQFSLGYTLRIGIIESLNLYSVQGVQSHVVLQSIFSYPDVPEPCHLAYIQRPNSESIAITISDSPPGYWVIAAADDIAYIEASYLWDEAAFEAMRIYKGTPRFSIDWDSTIHPMNANLVEFNGVSFDKGCYVGQEVTSRMHWRGGVKKKFYRVSIEHEPISVPQNISNDINIGKLTSACSTPDGCFGIAHLPVEFEHSDAQLTLASGGTISIIEPCHA